MGQLAIRGHETRGKEVIKILEMLGGKNTYYKLGNEDKLCYFIEFGTNIIASRYCDKLKNKSECYIVSLEDFSAKFPYKVGDKVQHKGATSCDSIFVIEKMQWVDSDIEYTIRNLWNINYRTTVKAEELQPYKEENFAECIENTVQECLFGKEETKKKEISGAIIDRFICLEGYDFYDDKGNVIDTKEITMKKKKPQYPKSYGECCKVLNLNNNLLLTYNDFTLETPYDDNLLILLGIFRQLKISRDAYWKIAGEEMGLGKPWEPDWNTNELKYIIYYENDKLWFNDEISRNTILAFPTEEMRDDFFDNFYKEIEECKEFL